jgi:hypothetical protein
MECLATTLPDIFETIFPGASDILSNAASIGKTTAIVVGTLISGILLFAFASLGASRRLNPDRNRRGMHRGTHRTM